MTHWMEYLTLLIAVLGAVLGIINTVHDMNRDRVRLRVRDRGWVNQGGQGWAVEVVNLSAFEVTIDKVVIPLPDHQELWLEEILRQLPHRLGPRTSASFRITAGTAQFNAVPDRGRFRVGTACGVTRETGEIQFRK